MWCWGEVSASLSRNAALTDPYSDTVYTIASFSHITECTLDTAMVTKVSYYSQKTTHEYSLVGVYHC